MNNEKHEARFHGNIYTVLLFTDDIALLLETVRGVKNQLNKLL